jgi:hypothetical protein
VAASDGELALVGVGLDSGGSAIIADEDSSLSLDDIIVEEGSTSFGSGATVEMRNSELRGSLFCYGEALIEDSSIFNLYQMEPQEGVPAVTLRRTTVDGTLDPDALLPSSMTVHAGSLTIDDSMVADSTLRIMGPASIDVRDSTITRSSVNFEDAAATLALRRVHYLDNSGPVRTEVAASVTIEDSLFEGNPVRALYAAGGAEWNVNGSSFVGNFVDGNAGGAIVLEDDTVLRIRNSTFAGNSFAPDAAADGARGAAIGYRNGSGAHLILTHVTIADPPDPPAGIVGSAVGGHGGGAAVDVSNSIVRGSCGMNNGVLQNNVGNVESPGNTCDFDPEFNDADVDSIDLALGALGDHGGPTPTFLPGEDSLVIDHASTPQCLAVDQRGYARPGGVRCDVGAVETDADDTQFADGFDG